METEVRNNGSTDGVKFRPEMMDSAPSDHCKDPLSNQSGKDEGAEIEQEQLERKKKTRRRKAKRKNPYTKQVSENRDKKNIRLRGEDHNDLQDFDVKLMAAANRGNENGTEVPNPTGGRVRDSSFTSAESDEDFFYSSPEDEEEFLTKEFSNAYQDLHVESLTSMTKAELIQQVLQLEEKVDSLQKRLGSKLCEEDEKNRSDGSEKSVNFQAEISKLALANKELQYENAKLREQKRCLSKSSEDSESDSSSSSDSSEVTTTDEEVDQDEFKNMNGEIHLESDNMDPTDNT